jgi:hypothetical protein
MRECSKEWFSKLLSRVAGSVLSFFGYCLLGVGGLKVGLKVGLRTGLTVGLRALSSSGIGFACHLYFPIFNFMFSTVSSSLICPGDPKLPFSSSFFLNLSFFFLFLSSFSF